MTGILANFKNRTLTRNGVTVKCSRQWFLIVAVLLASRGQLSCDDIFELLHGEDPDGGPLSKYIVSSTISSMRRGCRYGPHKRNWRNACLPPLGLVIASARGRSNSEYRIEILDPAALPDAAE